MGHQRPLTPGTAGRLPRRRLFGFLAAIPLAGALAPRLTRLAGGSWSRPAAAGTTATRCAACGSDRHHMLDAACPATPAGLV